MPKFGGPRRLPVVGEQLSDPAVFAYLCVISETRTLNGIDIPRMA